MAKMPELRPRNMNRPFALMAAIFSFLAILLARESQAFRRVDVGGHRLRVLKTGNGHPTVVFESGSGSPLETWVRVQPEVGKFTSTVSYDRAGNGLSPKGPTPRDGRQIALELHTMLHNANVQPPYILVGHSLGGPYIRVFAGMYPQEVTGMVLVDPTQEELIAWAKARESPAPADRELRLYDEVDCAPLTFDEAKTSRIPSGIPVILLTGMGPREVPNFLTQQLKEEVRKDREIFYPAKLRFHKAWVEQVSGGQLLITRNSGHGIPWEEPQLVVNAIRKVVESTRN